MATAWCASLCGHGIGKEMHEDPEVPNFGKPGHGLRLREGLCIAVEPHDHGRGDYRVYIAEDNWAFLTRDHSLSAALRKHFGDHGKRARR